MTQISPTIALATTLRQAQKLADLSVPRGFLACGVVQYKGRRVLMAIGGRNGPRNPHKTIEIMDLSTPGTDLTARTWTTLDVQLPHFVITDTKVINMGGAKNEILIISAHYKQVTLLNPNDGTFRNIQYQEKLNNAVTPIGSEFLPSCYNV